MKCNENYDLVGFINNEVMDAERQAIIRHISECSDCLHELADIRLIMSDLNHIRQIEPASDFTVRVIRAVCQAAPAQVPVQDADTSETVWNIIKYYFKRSPPWAYSTALHVTIFALLAFVFVSQAYKKPVIDQNAVRWTQLSLPKIGPVSDYGQSAQLPSDSVPDMEFISRSELNAKLRQSEDLLVSRLIRRSDPSARQELLTQYGGLDTEAAVNEGMKWLAQAQESSGSWTPSKYGGRDEYTAGLTGLATLCYTGQGNSHLSGPYAGTVDKSIRYLISIQQSDGQINTPRARPNMYNHSIATYALLEDYLLAHDYPEDTQTPDLLSEVLADALAKAIAFIINSQAADGGWGDYAGSRQPNTAVTVWQVRVLRLASLLEIDGLNETLAKSRQWLDLMANDDGLVGYQARLDYPHGPDTLTCAGLDAYLLIDSLPEFGGCHDNVKKRLDSLAGKQAAYLRNRAVSKSRSGGETDLCYWYWAGLAMISGEDWAQFNDALKLAVLMSQSPDGNWSVEDKWSVHGGELMATSMAVLALQVYYR